MTTSDSRELAEARTMLLLGWMAAHHSHRTLSGHVAVGAADCWGCQQIAQLMSWNQSRVSDEAQPPQIGPKGK